MAGVAKPLPARRKLHRGAGLGTVAKAGEGRWRARAPHTKASAERRTLGLFDSKASAERAAEVTARGEDLASLALAVVEERRVWRGLAHAGDRSVVRRHIVSDPLGAMRVEDVGVGDVRAWMGRMLQKPRARPGRWPEQAGAGAQLGGQLVTHALRLLRWTFARAVEQGRRPDNPALAVAVPRGAFRRKVGRFEGVLTPLEQAAVRGAAAGELRAMLDVAMGLALRPSELLGLRWEDVDLAAGAVVIRCGRRGGPTKTGEPRRLPLFGLARTALEAEAASRFGASRGEAYARVVPPPAAPPRARADATRQGDRGLVFPGRFGGLRLEPPTKAFRGALRSAGVVRTVTWRDLRHTGATSLLLGWWGRAWSPAEVQKLLGHATVGQTEAYLHARNEWLFEAAGATPGPGADPRSAPVPQGDVEETWPDADFPVDSSGQRRLFR